jgi:hypothetical protein
MNVCNVYNLNREGLFHFWTTIITGGPDVLVDYINEGIIHPMWSEYKDEYRLVSLPNNNINIMDAQAKVHDCLYNTMGKRGASSNWKNQLMGCRNSLSKGKMKEYDVDFILSLLSMAFRSTGHVTRSTHFDPGIRVFFGVSHSKKPIINNLHNLVFSMISGCNQNVFHFHFILIFSYPKNIPQLRFDL